jgi:hypothetical protein
MTAITPTSTQLRLLSQQLLHQHHDSQGEDLECSWFSCHLCAVPSRHCIATHQHKLHHLQQTAHMLTSPVQYLLQLMLLVMASSWQ